MKGAQTLSSHILKFSESGNLISDNIAFSWVVPSCLTFPMHDHEYYEISIMLQGRIQHVLPDEVSLLTPGDVIFIRPWDIHDFRMVNHEDFLFLNIPFTEQALMCLSDYLEEAFTVNALMRAKTPPCGKIDATLLYRAEALRKVDNIQNMRRALYTLLLEVISSAFLSQQEGPEDRGPAWFQRLCMEMMEMSNLREGLPRMYALCGRSPAHISRTFKKYMKVTPTGYINSLRIDHARKALKHTRQSILDISYSLGFESVSYFYRVFHRLTGMTPLEFRNGSRVD